MLCPEMVRFLAQFLVLDAWRFWRALLAATSFAQSIDPNAPSPVRSNTVTGSIAARDLGDARLTDHYYAFTGMPGDLLITIQSQNLNGDIDVFTVGSLRPLLKVDALRRDRDAGHKKYLSSPATRSDPACGSAQSE